MKTLAKRLWSSDGGARPHRIRPADRHHHARERDRHDSDWRKGESVLHEPGRGDAVRTGGVGGTRRQSALERSARLAHRLLTETEGQDLIEYALLTGIIAVGAAAVFPAIRTKMAAAYEAWLTGAQDLWEPSPPA